MGIRQPSRNCERAFPGIGEKDLDILVTQYGRCLRTNVIAVTVCSFTINSLMYKEKERVAVPARATPRLARNELHRITAIDLTLLLNQQFFLHCTNRILGGQAGGRRFGHCTRSPASAKDA
jgi:hypothetical protein